MKGGVVRGNLTLWEALDSLENGVKWAKSDVHKPSGSRCMLGAIMGAESFAEEHMVYLFAKTDRRVATVATVIHEQFPNFDHIESDVDLIWIFNDQQVGYDNVRMVLEKAAVRMDEEVIS